MPGTITFKPIEANLNHDTDLIGKADPYCMFTIGDQKVKGQVCKSGGKHPVWNDSITIPATNQSLCLVEVKDKDILKDDKMGSVEINLNEIERYGRLQKWFPLSHKGKPAGELLLEAVFTPVSHSYGVQGAPMQIGKPTVITSGVPVGAHMIGGASNNIQKTHITKETHIIPNQHHGVVPTTTYANVVPTSYPIHNNVSLAEQYAQESLIRGVDPLGTHLHQYPQQMTGNVGFFDNKPVPQSNLGHPQGINVPNYGTVGTHHHNQHQQNQQMTFGHGHMPNKY